MKTVAFKVEGLCCADCATKVEKVLKPVKGIMDLKILMAAEKAVVSYDEAEISAASSVNQAAITGESMPVEKKSGDEVFAANASRLLINSRKI